MGDIIKNVLHGELNSTVEYLGGMRKGGNFMQQWRALTPRVGLRWGGGVRRIQQRQLSEVALTYNCRDYRCYAHAGRNRMYMNHMFPLPGIPHLGAVIVLSVSRRGIARDPALGFLGKSMHIWSGEPCADPKEAVNYRATVDVRQRANMIVSHYLVWSADCGPPTNWEFDPRG